MSLPQTGYKVLTRSEMHALETEGRFAGAPVDLADGFVHLSAADQLTETVNKHFAGQEGLWVVAVDLAVLGDAVKWEESRGGNLFPHLYGELPLSAVVAYSELERAPDGSVRLPVTG